MLICELKNILKSDIIYIRETGNITCILDVQKTKERIDKMKLDFNYDGKTKLKDWWGKVKANFHTVQDEFNALDDKVSKEITDRQAADAQLKEEIDHEKDVRHTNDGYLLEIINDRVPLIIADTLPDVVISLVGVMGANSYSLGSIGVKRGDVNEYYILSKINTVPGPKTTYKLTWEKIPSIADVEEVANSLDNIKTSVNEIDQSISEESTKRVAADNLLYSLASKARIYDYSTNADLNYPGRQLLNLPIGAEFIMFNNRYDAQYPDDATTYGRLYVSGEFYYELSASIEPHKAYKCKIISQAETGVDGYDGEIEVIGEFTDSDAYNEINNKLEILSSSINHRNIFRGKNLGSAVTEEQKTAIQSGTFDDLFVGDYWEIDGTKWRIVDMDYWRNTGDTSSETRGNHHVVIIPDEPLYETVMNDSATTFGGYTGSKMYKEGLNQARELIRQVFGEMLFPHTEILVSGVEDGKPSAVQVPRQSSIELPNERMLCGSATFAATNDGVNIPSLQTIAKTQLALFRMAPEFITSNTSYWTRDIASMEKFIYMAFSGALSTGQANTEHGVRPVFAIG